MPQTPPLPAAGGPPGLAGPGGTSVAALPAGPEVGRSRQEQAGAGGGWRVPQRGAGGARGADAVMENSPGAKNNGREPRGRVTAGTGTRGAPTPTPRGTPRWAALCCLAPPPPPDTGDPSPPCGDTFALHVWRGGSPLEGAPQGFGGGGQEGGTGWGGGCPQHFPRDRLPGGTAVGGGTYGGDTHGGGHPLSHIFRGPPPLGRCPGAGGSQRGGGSRPCQAGRGGPAGQGVPGEVPALAQGPPAAVATAPGTLALSSWGHGHGATGTGGGWTRGEGCSSAGAPWFRASVSPPRGTLSPPSAFLPRSGGGGGGRPRHLGSCPPVPGVTRGWVAVGPRGGEYVGSSGTERWGGWQWAPGGVGRGAGGGLRAAGRPWVGAGAGDRADGERAHGWQWVGTPGVGGSWRRVGDVGAPRGRVPAGGGWVSRVGGCQSQVPGGSRRVPAGVGAPGVGGRGGAPRGGVPRVGGWRGSGRPGPPLLTPLPMALPSLLSARGTRGRRRRRRPRKTLPGPARPGPPRPRPQPGLPPSSAPLRAGPGPLPDPLSCSPRYVGDGPSSCRSPPRAVLGVSGPLPVSASPPSGGGRGTQASGAVGGPGRALGTQVSGPGGAPS